jgi:hypothetical protein
VWPDQAGWYSILTGLALLYVSYVLGSVPEDDAAMFVAVALAVTGISSAGCVPSSSGGPTRRKCLRSRWTKRPLISVA